MTPSLTISHPITYASPYNIIINIITKLMVSMPIYKGNKKPSKLDHRQLHKDTLFLGHHFAHQ